MEAIMYHFERKNDDNHLGVLVLIFETLFEHAHSLFQ